MVDVPNPKLTWLNELMSSTRSAVAATPDLDAPTKAIGPGSAWTGTKANQMHDNLLSPNASQFKQDLNELTADIQKVISATPKTVSAAEAQSMNKFHSMDRYN